MKKIRGFTLIELLVVISIIALLTAILMPALRKARSQARGVVCLAHLRSYGHAFFLYAEDNDGFLVPARVERGNGQEVWWDEILLKYHGTEELRICPMATQSPPSGAVGGPRWYWHHGDDVPRGYGMNGWAMPWTKHLEDSGWIPRRGREMLWEKLYSCRPASEIPLATDAAWGLGFPSETDQMRLNTWVFGDGGWMSSYAIDRHFGHVNGIMADGSVKKIRLPDLWTLRWYRRWTPRYDVIIPWYKY